MRSWSASLCAVAVVFAIGCGLDRAQAQSYPSRTITFVVPFAPGGSTSIIGRVIADKMSQLLGQSIVIDHRPGAGGTVGTKAVAKSDPDGYTLLLGYTGTLAIGPSLYKNPGYDPRKDFADRLCEGPSRQGQFRLRRRRHPRPHHRRVFRPHRRHHARAHSL
jgi:tripartite-type tricarboxylate transporter receptor subunit TctC